MLSAFVMDMFNPRLPSYLAVCVYQVTLVANPWRRKEGQSKIWMTLSKLIHKWPTQHRLQWVKRNSQTKKTLKMTWKKADCVRIVVSAWIFHQGRRMSAFWCGHLPRPIIKESVFLRHILPDNSKLEYLELLFISSLPRAGRVLINTFHFCRLDIFGGERLAVRWVFLVSDSDRDSALFC